MIYRVFVKKKSFMFNAIGMCVNLIKSLRIIKPEFDIIFPSRLPSILKEPIYHKDKKMFSEYINLEEKYAMYHIVITPGGR